MSLTIAFAALVVLMALSFAINGGASFAILALSTTSSVALSSLWLWSIYFITSAVPVGGGQPKRTSLSSALYLLPPLAASTFWIGAALDDNFVLAERLFAQPVYTGGLSIVRELGLWGVLAGMIGCLAGSSLSLARFQTPAARTTSFQVLAIALEISSPFAGIWTVHGRLSGILRQMGKMS